jgi:aquaporin Z
MTDGASPAQTLRKHWPEYLMEAWGLGTFMVSAGLVTTLLESAGSPLHRWINNGEVRRLLIGIAMGLTAIAIIYSPWGKQSGAHLNPAVTLTFLRLGKIHPFDAAGYIIAQFTGGVLGVLLVWAIIGSGFSEPPVHFVNTTPGTGGALPAYAAEVGMSFAIMLMVLAALSHARTNGLAGVFAGILVATYITVLGPVSGMSINPARSFASALPAQLWDFLWIYFTAPVLGMLLAVEVFRLTRWSRAWICAKLNHDPHYRCIHCHYRPASAAKDRPGREDQTR